MNIQTVTELIPVIQTATAPIILISGIGLLILTMTNRLGRAIDRSRILSGELQKSHGEKAIAIEKQLKILWKRAQLIRLSITLVSVNVLCASILIIVLFLSTLLQVEVVTFVTLLFILCIASLIASIILFIFDIYMSLSALKLELKIEK